MKQKRRKVGEPEDMATRATPLSDATQKPASAVVFLLLKNLLFWGSMALSGYVLYVLVSFTLG